MNRVVAAEKEEAKKSFINTERRKKEIIRETMNKIHHSFSNCGRSITAGTPITLYWCTGVKQNQNIKRIKNLRNKKINSYIFYNTQHC
jgi:hypothetical protein